MTKMELLLKASSVLKAEEIYILLRMMAICPSKPRKWTQYGEEIDLKAGEILLTSTIVRDKLKIGRTSAWRILKKLSDLNYIIKSPKSRTGFNAFSIYTINASEVKVGTQMNAVSNVESLAYKVEQERIGTHLTLEESFGTQNVTQIDSPTITESKTYETSLSQVGTQFGTDKELREDNIREDKSIIKSVMATSDESPIDELKEEVERSASFWKPWTSKNGRIVVKKDEFLSFYNGYSDNLEVLKKIRLRALTMGWGSEKIKSLLSSAVDNKIAVGNLSDVSISEIVERI